MQLTDKEKCKITRKIHCKIESYGFASQIHSLMSCFLKGYYGKKLVVIDQIFNNYLVRYNFSWDQFISPISETCQPNHLFKYELNKLNQEEIVQRNCKLLFI
jgi:hypothetical protein